MTYPKLAKEAAWGAFNTYKSGDDVGTVVDEATVLKEGGEFDMAASVDLSNLLWELAGNEGKSGYRFEREAATVVHERLQLLPIIAGDPGFWRWLTFTVDGQLAELVDWRYPAQETGHARDQYFGLGQPKAGMYNYLWLCADAVVDQTLFDPYELCRRGDVDIWQSHIVRVDFGSVPQLARAFLRFVYPSDGGQVLSREEYRHLAKEITRRNAAMSFEMLDDEASLELIGEIWNERNVWEPTVGLA